MEQARNPSVTTATTLRTGEPVNLNTERAFGALLGLTLIMGGGNLWASWDEVHR